MSLANRLIFKIKRSNSPVFKFIKKILRFVFLPTLPPFPRSIITLFRPLYELHFLMIVVFRSLIIIFYRNPLFQTRCASFGRRVTLEGLPYVGGHVEIHIGDDVRIGAGMAVLSGGAFEHPTLILKDRCSIGGGTKLTVNREVIVEEDVLISYDCRIIDSDAHPKEADLRAAGVCPDVKDSRPVRIGRYAFIGNGAHIMKGVTIGEGATVAANSVVISNIPPYSLAIGNPAEILFRNYGLPSTAERKKKPRAAVETDH